MLSELCAAALKRWRGHHRLQRLLADELGATAIEYGLLAAGVSVFILVAVFAMGDELNNLFTAVQTKISNAYS